MAYAVWPSAATRAKPAGGGTIAQPAAGTLGLTGHLPFSTNSSGGAPAYIAALGDYTVTKYTSVANGKANVNDIIPATWISASGTSNYGQNFNITAAFSGGTADVANALLISNGGGHSDSACNVWWKADFTGTDKPVGFSLLAYTNPAGVSPETDPQSNGVPNSTHTYGSMSFDPVHHRAHRYAGANWSSGSMPTKNWAIDLSDNSFVQGPDTPYAADNAACSIYGGDSVRKNLILNHAGQGWFHRLDANTRSSSINWNGTNGSDGNPIAAYDTSRARAIITAPNQMYLVMPNWAAETISESTLTPTGATTAIALRGSPPLYDPVADVFWILPLGDGATGMTTIYSMHPTTWVITAHTVTGATTGYTPSGASSGLFNRVCPMFAWRAIGFVTDINGGMYVLKLPATT